MRPPFARGVFLFKRPSVKDIQDRQRVSIVTKETTVAERAGYGGFPPENSNAAIVRSAQNDAVYFVQEFTLAVGCLGEGATFRSVLRGPPTVCDLHQHDVFLVFVRHKDQIFAKVEQRPVPPRVERLADHVEIHVAGSQVIEEVFCGAFVAAFVDMNHDPGNRVRSAPGIDIPDAGLEEVGKVIPILRQFAVGPKHSRCDLVSDLHNVGHGFGVMKRDDRVPRVFESVLLLSERGRTVCNNEANS